MQNWQKTSFLSGLYTDVLWSIVDNTIAQLDYDDIVIYLLDQESGKLHQCVAHGLKRSGSRQILRPIMIPVGSGVVGNVAKSASPFITSDTSACSDYIVDIEMGKSEIAVPIIYNDQVIGVIDSESRQTDYYSGYDISIFTELASITSSALTANFHQRNLEKLLTQNRKKSTLADTWKTQSLDYRNAFESDHQILRKLTKTQRKILYELNKNKTSKQIAESLNINFRTVQVHRQNICTRLGLKGPNALLHFASKLRITDGITHET